jgi:hypothetical protein
MKANRREFLDETFAPWKKAVGLLGIGFVLSKCSSSPTTVAPSSSRLAPLDLVVGVASGKSINAPPTYNGYANGGESLLAAMRNAGLDPTPILRGFLGAGSFGFSVPSEFGWIFAVQNSVFGSDAGSVLLGQDQLWAAYKKLSVG